MIRSFYGMNPVIHPTAFVSEAAYVIGDVEVGEGSSIWPGVVIRGDTGKIKIIFRDFPLNYPALAGSMLLQCIDNQIRYDYLSAFFALQSKWVNADIEIVKKELYKIMQLGGMSKNTYNECIEKKEVEEKILKGLMDAKNEFGISLKLFFD